MWHQALCNHTKTWICIHTKTLVSAFSNLVDSSHSLLRMPMLIELSSCHSSAISKLYETSFPCTQGSCQEVMDCHSHHHPSRKGVDTNKAFVQFRKKKCMKGKDVEWQCYGKGSWALNRTAIMASCRFDALMTAYLPDWVSLQVRSCYTCFPQIKRIFNAPRIPAIQEMQSMHIVDFDFRDIMWWPEFLSFDMYDMTRYMRALQACRHTTLTEAHLDELYLLPTDLLEYQHRQWQFFVQIVIHSQQGQRLSSEPPPTLDTLVLYNYARWARLMTWLSMVKHRFFVNQLEDGDGAVDNVDTIAKHLNIHRLQGLQHIFIVRCRFQIFCLRYVTVTCVWTRCCLSYWFFQPAMSISEL